MATRGALKASRGFEFVKRGSSVMLRRTGATGAGATFTCGCQNTDKSCKVVIDGTDAMCLNDGCSSCAWEVRVAGLANARIFAKVVARPGRTSTGRTPTGPTR
jgi:hypothetical protein